LRRVSLAMRLNYYPVQIGLVQKIFMSQKIYANGENIFVFCQNESFFYLLRNFQSFHK